MAGLAIDAIEELVIGLAAAAEVLVGRKIVAHTIGPAAAAAAEVLVGRQVEIGP